ncbi:hypothetical protein SH1V18_03590 [Vallitalea longa]|uniref:IrrE N-terminal-like domain-containing protein n=1 Tax=Vallitalea longa TaxID=2936439 RepID=A0A9W5Y9I8_9FIRM|nr:ImmA/IrrE family metallo-endopeptidase [Vallitalea longa]GKX27879.1 hypothetical protein SH1V18_03590 [Vallitalea longa]
MTKLLQYIEDENIQLIEADIPVKKLKGLYYDNTIIIDKEVSTTIQKKCILAEEIGHYFTSTGDILDQSNITNKKQENKARAWAFEKLIGLMDIINAYKCGVRNKFELAEYLDVTEEFLNEAVEYYKRKHGILFKLDNYIIYFEPLGVIEIL